LRFICKVLPVEPHPAFPKDKSHWAAIVPVRLIYKHSPPTQRIEAWIDSGSPDCMFHASLGKPLGIKRVEDGIPHKLGGVIGGPTANMYFHKVKIMIGEHQFQTMAGFCWTLSWAALLGRRGFFENFIVRIDSSENPPVIDLEKIHRS